MLEQKVYLFLESLAQLNDLNLHFVLIILVLLDIYSMLLFFESQFFNCGSNFELS